MLRAARPFFNLPVFSGATDVVSGSLVSSAPIFLEDKEVRYASRRLAR